MLLLFECLLIKLPFTKFWELTIEHFKWFILNIANPMNDFFKSIRTCLSTKSIYVFWLEKFIKALWDFNPELMPHCFNTDCIPWNLIKGNRLLIPPVKSVNFGTNSITFRGILSWNNLLLKLKNSQTIDDFKFEVKNVGKIHCICTVCH